MMALHLRTEERLLLHFEVGVRLLIHFQCLISAGDILLAQLVAFPTLVFARSACFIKEDIKIVLANLESFLELYTHSSLHRGRERERE